MVKALNWITHKSEDDNNLLQPITFSSQALPTVQPRQVSPVAPAAPARPIMAPAPVMRPTAAPVRVPNVIQAPSSNSFNPFGQTQTLAPIVKPYPMQVPVQPKLKPVKLFNDQLMGAADTVYGGINDAGSTIGSLVGSVLPWGDANLYSDKGRQNLTQNLQNETYNPDTGQWFQAGKDAVKKVKSDLTSGNVEASVGDALTTLTNASMFLPIGAGVNAAKTIGEGVVKDALKTIAKSSLIGGAYSGTSAAANAMQNNASPLEVLKQGAESVPLGMVAGAALPIVAKGIEKGVGKVANDLKTAQTSPDAQAGYLTFPGSDKLTAEQYHAEVLKKIQSEADHFFANEKATKESLAANSGGATAKEQNVIFNQNKTLAREIQKDPIAFIDKYNLLPPDKIVTKPVVPPKLKPIETTVKPTPSIEPTSIKVKPTPQVSKPNYRSAHQIDTTTSRNLGDISNVDDIVGTVKSKYGLSNYDQKDITNLKKIIGNPEADVKIYRSSPINEINDGDWVTTSKTYANDIKAQNGGKVYEYTVKAKNLNLPQNIEDNPSLARFSAFQYNKSKVAPQVSKTDLIPRDKTGMKLTHPYTGDPLPLNPDGTITVYHSTTKDGASKISSEGLKGSKVEDGNVFFTTSPKGWQNIGQGKDTVLKFNIDPNKLKMDDITRGQYHFSAKDADLNGIRPVAPQVSKTPAVIKPIVAKARVAPKEVVKPVLRIPQPLKTSLQPVQQTRPRLAPSSPKTKIKSSYNAIVTPKVKNTRGLVQSVQKSGNISPDVKPLVKGKYVPKPNTKLMGEAQALLSEGASIDFKNTKNLDQKVAATIQEALNQQKAGNHQAAADLFNNLSEHGTELGRGVQAFSLLKNMSPESVALSVAGKIKKFNATHNFKKIPELGADQMKIIADKMSEIDLLTGRDKGIAMNELSKTINDFIPSTVADKAIAVWKAGLLTSLRTHERNFVGNAVHGIAEVAKDVPATATDAILGLKTGTRTKTMTLRGSGEFGSKTTRQQVKDIISKGYDPTSMVQKFDYKTVTWGKGPVQQTLKKYTEVVFNTLGAEDKPFYNAALARSLYDQAGAAAINAGKRGNKSFIENLVKNPTEEMTKIAIGDANISVFKNKNMASKAVGMLKMQLDKNELSKVVGEVAMPFTGVPSSIAGQMVAYSPIGLMKGIARSGAVLAGKVPEMQRQAAQEVGRGVIGTGLVGLGAYLTQQGLMTGQPKDSKEADQWTLEGKQANSIMIGGQWRSINSVGPEALVMLAGSKIAQGKDAGTTAANIGKDFVGQTFLQGMSQPLQAIADPARYGKSYVSNQISSVIPNIVKDTSKALDPIQRKTTGTDMGSSIVDSLKSGIPGLRNTLPAKRDVLGNGMKQEPTGVGAFVDLFNSKTPIKNPVVNELSRLNAVDLNATPSAVSNTANKAGVKLTPQELDKLEAYSGGQVSSGLDSLIKSDAYNMMSDEQKKTSIDNLVTKIKTQAKLNIAGGNTSDISVSAGVNSTDLKLTYQQHLDAYNKGIKDKTITGPDVMTKKTALDKEEITSQYSSEVKDFYNLSNAAKSAYFASDPTKAQELYDQAKTMDSKLVDKGLATTKFKTTTSPGSSKSSSGSSGSVSPASSRAAAKAAASAMIAAAKLTPNAKLAPVSAVKQAVYRQVPVASTSQAAATNKYAPIKISAKDRSKKS